MALIRRNFLALAASAATGAQGVSCKATPPLALAQRLTWVARQFSSAGFAGVSFSVGSTSSGKAGPLPRAGIASNSNDRTTAGLMTGSGALAVAIDKGDHRAEDEQHNAIEDDLPGDQRPRR